MEQTKINHIRKIFCTLKVQSVISLKNREKKYKYVYKTAQVVIQYPFIIGYVV